MAGRSPGRNKVASLALLAPVLALGAWLTPYRGGSSEAVPGIARRSVRSTTQRTAPAGPAAGPAEASVRESDLLEGGAPAADEAGGPSARRKSSRSNMPGAAARPDGAGLDRAPGAVQVPLPTPRFQPGDDDGTADALSRALRDQVRQARRREGLQVRMRQPVHAGAFPTA